MNAFYLKKGHTNRNPNIQQFQRRNKAKQQSGLKYF